MGSWEEDHRGKVPFSSYHIIISVVHVLNMNYCCWCLGHLTEVMFVRFLKCKVLPSTTYFSFWREVTVWSPLKWWGIMVHLLYSKNSSVQQICLFSPSYFSQSLISIWIHGYLFCTLLYNPILLYLLLKLFSLAIGNSELAPVSLRHARIGLFCEHFFVFLVL